MNAALALHRRLLALPQGLRFLAAGGFAAAVNWVVRFPLDLVMPFVAAVAAATMIGMVVGFVIYRAFVFPATTRPLAAQIRDFVGVNLLGMAVVTAVAALLAEALFPALGLAFHPEAIAHAAGIAAGAVANYLGHKRVTFRPATAKPQ